MSNKFFAGLALALGLAFAFPALADTVTVPTKGKGLAVEVPAGWDTEEVKRGIEFSTEDEEVFLWIEAYVDSEFEAVKKEVAAYLEEQGIEIKGEPKITPHDFDKYGLATLDFPATWNGETTILRYLLIEPKNPGKSRLILSYWATPAGDKKHDAETQKLVDSFARALDND